MRGDQPRAVELDLSVLADHPKFHREPEEPGHAVQVLLAGETGADLPIALQKVGKDRMRVHGHVAEDIVEDVRLRRVFERLAGAQRGGGGKAPRCDHFKESRAGQVARDRGCVPAGARRQQGVHLSQIGDDVLAQADVVKAVEVLLACMLFELGHAAAHQLGPHGVLVRGIPAPVLLDEIRRSKRKARSRNGSGHGEVPLWIKDRTTCGMLFSQAYAPEANPAAWQSGSAVSMHMALQ